MDGLREPGRTVSGRQRYEGCLSRERTKTTDTHGRLAQPAGLAEVRRTGAGGGDGQDVADCLAMCHGRGPAQALH